LHSETKFAEHPDEASRRAKAGPFVVQQ
jgi:hypothetical protein